MQRDPGFLSLEGVWLTTHADPSIPIRSAAELSGQIPDVRVISDAFWRFGDEMHAQGAKTFPGLLAMVGWVFGLRGVLVANLLIGALGLLAVYDVARRLISPRWGVVPVATLALSTPMIYFSRATFTEPTNIVLTFGGLAVLWSAFRDPRLSRFALGGAMVGATALSRIDGAAVSAGLILGLGRGRRCERPGRPPAPDLGTARGDGCLPGHGRARVPRPGAAQRWIPRGPPQPVRAAPGAARGLPGGGRRPDRGAALGAAALLAGWPAGAAGHGRRRSGRCRGRGAGQPSAVDAAAPDRARLRAGMVHRGRPARRGRGRGRDPQLRRDDRDLARVVPGAAHVGARGGRNGAADAALHRRLAARGPGAAGHARDPGAALPDPPGDHPRPHLGDAPVPARRDPRRAADGRMDPAPDPPGGPVAMAAHRRVGRSWPGSCSHRWRPGGR